jgi:hypothetical protein
MFDRILEEKLVILTAVERGGKTALAKQFVRSFRQRGVIPVYLSCRDCKVSPDNVEKCLRRGVAAQYGEAWVEAFEQLPAERRVIIVDDIDRLTLGRSSKVELLQRLAQFAGYVVVFANEFTRQIEDVVYSRDGLVVEFDFQPYRIQEFGHALRYALAQRWFGIGLNLAAANERLEQQWSRARRIMDTVVGKNFIPAIPVFLLSILQTLEADRPFDTNASTYGYFYEMFIREALVGFAREFDPNTTSTYLSYMAWDMFSANSFTLSDQAMRTVHATYEGEMDLKLSYRRLMDAFVKARILGNCLPR